MAFPHVWLSHVCGMRAAEEEALDYSEEEPAEPRVSVVRRSRGALRGSGKALSNDEEDYSDHFECDYSDHFECDDSVQESRATSQPSSRGASINEHRRSERGPPSQPLTARSQSQSTPRRHSLESDALQPPQIHPSRDGSDRSWTPPIPEAPQVLQVPIPAPQVLPAPPSGPGLVDPEWSRPMERAGVNAQVPPLPLLRPVPELPTPVEQWRTPMEPGVLGVQVRPPSEEEELAEKQELRSCLVRAWDIAAMAGPEPRSPEREVDTVARSKGDLSRLGGPKSMAPMAVEAELVDALLARFVLEHKAPTLQRRERAAYKEMLEQVSWTALEPKAAKEAASLLSKHFLAPVSANEALRAFRRCLHSILCDERVLDIVEHQMTLNFSRLGKPTGEPRRELREA